MATPDSLPRTGGPGAVGSEAKSPEGALSRADGLHTTHLYYSDTELYSNAGKVIATREEEANGEKLVVLVTDETVMHPQGGGQPADNGMISNADGSIQFKVSHVQKPRGCEHIEHLGKYLDKEKRFSVGDEVRIEVDAQRRQLNARLHSAGHLLDSAFTNIGMVDLIPSKGYHFPEGPYVEYIGNVPPEKREEVLRQLNAECERLVQEAIPVIVTKNKEGERIVNVGGSECPCGGTHVKNTAVIGGVTVTKIKKSKKNVRVSYLVNDE